MQTTWTRFIFCGLISVGLASHADLVWHSAMDGNADAIVGVDGVATGTPTGIVDKNGNPNGAVDFSGGNFFYEVDASPEITSLTEGSMSFWVNWNGSGGEQGIVAMGVSGGGQTEYFTAMRQSATTLRTDVDDGDDGVGRVAPFSNSVANGVWYHVVAAFAATDAVDLYVDGSLANSFSVAAGESSIDGLNTWLVGSERTGERFLDGALDDVRFYNHRLSQGEVTALFNDGPLYAAVPEASGFSLIGFGLVLMAAFRRRL